MCSVRGVRVRPLPRRRLIDASLTSSICRYLFFQAELSRTDGVTQDGAERSQSSLPFLQGRHVACCEGTSRRGNPRRFIRAISSGGFFASVAAALIACAPGVRLRCPFPPVPSVCAAVCSSFLSLSLSLSRSALLIDPAPRLQMDSIRFDLRRIALDSTTAQGDILRPYALETASESGVSCEATADRRDHLLVIGVQRTSHRLQWLACGEGSRADDVQGDSSSHALCGAEAAIRRVWRRQRAGAHRLLAAQRAGGSGRDTARVRAHVRVR